MAEISRRGALGALVVCLAGAGGAALGLTRGIHHKVALPPPPPPQVLTDILQGEQRLLAGYDSAIAATQLAALPALRTDVAAHIDALHALLEFYPGWRLAQHDASASTSAQPSASSSTSSSISPNGGGQPPVAGSVPALAAATRALRASAASACVDWHPADGHGDQAVPLLGSIAACLSTHLEVLT